MTSAIKLGWRPRKHRKGCGTYRPPGPPIIGALVCDKSCRCWCHADHLLTIQSLGNVEVKCSCGRWRISTMGISMTKRQILDLFSIHTRAERIVKICRQHAANVKGNS